MLLLFIEAFLVRRSMHKKKNFLYLGVRPWGAQGSLLAGLWGLSVVLELNLGKRLAVLSLWHPGILMKDLYSNLRSCFWVSDEETEAHYDAHESRSSFK